MAGYKITTVEERKKIEELYAIGTPIKIIAEQTGVSASSIYCELKRGQDGKLDKNFRPKYSAELAQKNVMESLRRRGRRKEE